MSASTEIEKTEQPTELEVSPEEQALIAGIKSKIDRDDLILPQIRLAAPLSKSVKNKIAEPGDFVNTLTSENYGSKFELVIVDYFKGRFFDDGKGGIFVAMSDVAPANWPEQYAGKHFADLPDAEEQFSELANAEGGEWGDGPPISTTYNYIGFVTGDEVSQIPVRLSLKRTSKPTARKINTLIDLSNAPWDKVFTISSIEKSNARGDDYHVTDAGQGRPTTPDERSAAVKIAMQLQQASITLHGDDERAEKAAPPAARQGALSDDI